jgi:hypothetical protein
MLSSLEYRGTDASGIALQKRSGQILVLKAQASAWRFIHDKEFGFSDFCDRELADEADPVDLALVHTRKATVGNPHRSENNHPLYSGDSAIVHNGACRNHEELFRELKLQRGAETDSDVIRAIIDQKGLTRKAVKDLAKIQGTVSSCCISPKFPGKFMLLRSGNPLVLAASKQKLYWASDRRTIFRASKPWVKRWGVLMQVPHSDLAFINVYEDSAWIFGPGGFEHHEEFKLTGSNFGGNLTYQLYDGTWVSRAARWKEEYEREEAKKRQPLAQLPAQNESSSLLPAFVYCPNEKCLNKAGQRTLIELTAVQRGWQLWRLQCTICETGLENAKISKRQVN